MTTQNTQRLNLKTCKALMANNFLTKGGKEYCEFAIRARIVELETKAAAKAVKAQAKHEKTFLTQEAASILPPPLVNRSSQVVSALMTKVKKAFGFTFSKSLEQLENNVVTTTYKFEVKF